MADWDCVVECFCWYDLWLPNFRADGGVQIRLGSKDWRGLPPLSAACGRVPCPHLCRLQASIPMAMSPPHYSDCDRRVSSCRQDVIWERYRSYFKVEKNWGLRAQQPVNTAEDLVRSMLVITGGTGKGVTRKRSICSPQKQQGLLDHTYGPDSAGAGGACEAGWEKERPDVSITLELKCWSSLFLGSLSSASLAAASLDSDGCGVGCIMGVRSWLSLHGHCIHSNFPLSHILYLPPVCWGPSSSGGRSQLPWG